GSSYEIGRQALIAVGREYDGLGPKTELTSLVLNSLNIEDAGLIPQVIYRDSALKLRIANLSLVAAKAAQAGDLVARDLFLRGGKGLGEMACAVIRQLHLNESAVLVSGVGGVFQTGELIWNPYREEVLRQFRQASVVSPRFSSVVGALLLAYQRGGVEISCSLLEKLEAAHLR
ncbi:MAG: hypothetical protein DMG06_14930, partial [Acidobacteria bacterium]